MFPAQFIKILTESIGDRRTESLLSALSGEPAVSVRVNPAKYSVERLRMHFGPLAGDPVPWAEGEAFYLNERPAFTFDPLFHTGAYYVQEASSMYVGYLFDRAVAGIPDPAVLDLCAAPGGKTTQIISHLGNGTLISNEVISSRVPVLAENVSRWGRDDVLVSNSDAAAFGRQKDTFDVVVCDVPCSGEGMFRKDEKAVDNWSLDNVRLCAARQRRIVADVWPALREGGSMIYSTCTFNHFEDEDNVEWICNELGGQCLEMRHFYPGEIMGEGFFAAMIRKSGDACRHAKLDTKRIRIYQSSFPEADMALSLRLDKSKYTVRDLTRQDALRFLAKEPLSFEDAPLGLILLTYEDLPLGFVKNLGRRSNNLIPMPRRIKNISTTTIKNI